MRNPDFAARKAAGDLRLGVPHDADVWIAERQRDLNFKPKKLSHQAPDQQARRRPLGQWRPDHLERAQQSTEEGHTSTHCPFTSRSAVMKIRGSVVWSGMSASLG
jgi:hypothetical protein